MPRTFNISCHCGNIRLEVTAELGEVVECNCSICVRGGFLHWYVAPEQVDLETLSTYFRSSATGGKHFSSGVRHSGGSHVDTVSPPVSINARCLEDVDIWSLRIRQFDGKHAYP